MSFSSDVKKEILVQNYEQEDEIKAFLYGLTLFSRAFSFREISMLAENFEVASLFKKLTSYICNVDVSLSKTKAGKGKAVVLSASDRKKLMDFWGYGTKSNTARINHANLPDEECRKPFLSGAFLSCGTVSDPNKSYHLEFVVPYKHLAEDLLWVLSNMDDIELNTKMTRRNSNYVIYFRDSASIENMLTLMGAVNSSLEFMGIKMYKDMRNHVNRKLNFENANLDKTIDASARHVKAIEKIINNKGIDSLEPDLRELALLRYENPAMSLAELVDSLSYDISRSGVNHRLDKICRIAESIK
ncbi:MAG: DNA-binding protein WhiA [Clostridiales bacterium]|nr:DNA-binding protein WhiA [Clostridiales bacterium]